ncbi:TetR family transcriptional regulator [Lactobacillus sp. S2-2]|uniref:TetR/AcrR family transcriptional regulator n=1 Tax=Lactobacillus sp. S2-2 TaxID=2692917 RepID=UPI001F375D3E|nr:TetR/AcrR family transcriptional regulator [Lactobacillus sp. S2-2]MCF6515352.1 TetR family transcriptional regulator [Lactobacillus sp. S2-2]
MSNLNDLRTIKTLNSIETAFINLLTIKNFKNITINDISKEAIINRSTFYLHFNDKYQLLDLLINKYIKNVISTVSAKSHIKNNKLDYESFFNDLEKALNIISKQPLFYKFILNDPEFLGTHRKTEEYFIEELDKSYPQKTAVERELLIKATSSIYISVISWWLNNDMVYSTKFIANEIVKLFNLGSANLISY